MERNRGKKHSHYDPRTWLFLNLISVIGISLVKSEIGALILFAICILIHMVTGNTKNVIGYIFQYAILLGLTWLGVQIVESQTFVPTGMLFTTTGALGRRMMIPITFLIILISIPTGTLLGAIHKLKLPKAVGIGFAVFLRFMPTIWQEYRFIRNSQKFRGIGVGILNTLIHFPLVLEYILIPLILRTTKISEELSASVTVRGVRFSGNIISFRELSIKEKDIILSIGTLVLYITVFIVDWLYLGGKL